jgi:GT2 family glycosyltransferase
VTDTLGRTFPAAPVAISVVVCCYTERRWNDILAAVESVQAQTLPPLEIIVVVDYCPPLLERLRQELDGVTVIPNAHHQGLSGGRNTGIDVSAGDVVAFLDDDAVADPEWLQLFAGEYTDTAVIAVGGHTDPLWAEPPASWFPSEFGWVVGCSYTGLPTRRTTVRNVFGGNMSFRRKVLTELGGFRDGIGRAGKRPLGCEETELCIRAAGHGGDIVYQPQAKIMHRVPPERSTFAYFRSRCYAEGLSKAAVANLSGSRKALETERSYVARTLPAGVIAGLSGGLLRREAGALRRAGVIVAGLGVTTAGYIAGRTRDMFRAVWATRSELFTLMPLLAALLLWLISLRHIDLSAMNDVGLVSVLPLTYWCALATLVATFPALVHRGKTRTSVLAAHLVTLLVIIHATPAVLYGSPRYSWTWKHIGIVDYIIRHGDVDPHISYLSAYHSWPGFFALNAFVAQAAGLDGAAGYAAWGPVFFEVLYLAPLVLLFRTFTADRRRVWLAVGLFYLSNWVGQDYFSPQAFGFFFYLVVLSLCLRWLPRLPNPRWRTAPLLTEMTPRSQRPAFLAIVIICVATIVVSHQLTPYMLISALVILVIAKHLEPWWLPVAAIVLTAGYTVIAAYPFLQDNLYWIVQSIGHPTGNTAGAFVKLEDAPYGQAIVDYSDRGLSAFMWLLAALGAYRGWRKHQLDLVAILLLLAPVPLLFLNSYGGEMLFRVYLFASPFVALLASRVVYPTWPTSGVKKRQPLAAALLCFVVTVPFVLGYYGKERANYFSPDTVAASRWLFAHAPAGSLISGVTSNLPWAFTYYEEYSYVWLLNLPADQRRELGVNPVEVTADTMDGNTKSPNRYFIVTSSEEIDIEYTGAFRAGTLARLTAALRASSRFHPVYENPDAVIFQLDPPRTEETTPSAANGRPGG